MTRNTAIIFACLIGALSACTTQSTQKSDGPQDREKIAEINTQIAVAYMRDGDNELALKKLEKAIDADPTHAPAYSTMGLLYHRIGEFEKADNNFKKALRIEPNNSSILNNYGQILCQHGDYARGQEMFLKSKENPLYRNPEVTLTNAGTCAVQAGDHVTAEKHFRDALQINPRIAPALLQMSDISYAAARYLPARAYLQRYLEIGAHTAQSLWLGIKIERELGDKDALSSYGLQLEKSFPDSNEARLLLESKEN